MFLLIGLTIVLIVGLILLFLIIRRQLNLVDKDDTQPITNEAVLLDGESDSQMVVGSVSKEMFVRGGKGNPLMWVYDHKLDREYGAYATTTVAQLDNQHFITAYSNSNNNEIIETYEIGGQYDEGAKYLWQWAEALKEEEKRIYSKV